MDELQQPTQEQNAGDHGAASSDQLYLAKLQFRAELRKSWLNFFVTNFRVVLLLILIITTGGLYAFFKLPRESNPEVKIPIAIVITTYPGASPSDVEEFVTKKIEPKVAGLKGLKKLTSTSANSVSSLTVEFDAKENLEDAVRRLKDKVDSAKPDLPKEAKEPIVQEISLDDQPVINVVLTGPQDGFTLRKNAEDLSDELKKIVGVREVIISGGDEREFSVEINPERLQFYNLSVDQINGSIAAANIVFPAGNFEGEKFIYPVRTDGRLFSVTEIENLPVTVTAEGSTVRLKDIAQVKDQAIKRTTLARLSIQASAPRSAVSVAVVKRTGSSVIALTDQVKKVTGEQVRTMPAGTHFDVVFDISKFVRQDFDHLSRDFLITLLLVFGLLFLVVGLKEALVAGLAIPLVFFVTFGVLLTMGITLNFLSLFSLILSLGLLVDDAIVVVSATKQYLRSGKFTPEEAVLLVLNDFKVVLTTTTLTTVWAFLPLLFATGIIGEYLKSIPITVSTTLIASLFIALMINHPLAAVLERIRLTRWLFFLLEVLILVIVGASVYVGGLGYAIGIVGLAIMAGMLWYYERGGKEKLIKNAEQVEKEWADDTLIKHKLATHSSSNQTSFTNRLLHGIFKFDLVLPLYERALRWVLETKKHRRLLIGSAVLIFILAVALPVTGLLPTEFFPQQDSENVYVDMRAPVGLKLEETNLVASHAEERLLKYPDIVNFNTVIGRPSPINQTDRAGSNIASISITLKEKEKRNITSYAFAEKLRKDFTDFSGAVVKVSAEAGGPPTGAAFEARIKGDDLNKLKEITSELKQKLSSVPGVVNVDISLKDSAPEYTFTLDQQKLSENALTAISVGSTLRTAISGSEVSTVLLNNKEIKIVTRFSGDQVPNLEALKNLQVVNLRKQPVYLKDVATIELKPAVDAITRIDQKRTVLLSAGVDSTTNSTKVLADFQSKIKDYKFPNGYSIEYGGENQSNQESVLSIIQAMVIALLLIVSTLIIQFNSFRKAIIVLVTIPLALTGTFIGMAAAGLSLNFPALIGTLALFGIVVKNAIILVDKINLNLKTGIPFLEAIIDAGKSRSEAIFITSICTILGILPITLTDDFWKGLGSAVIFGLMLSSFLTLFVIPTLFAMWVKPKREVIS